MNAQSMYRIFLEKVSCEYFQSLEKFHEDGLPDGLPGRLAADVEKDPRLLDLQTQLHALMGPGGDNHAFSTVQRQLTNCLRRLKREALHLYQESWI